MDAEKLRELIEADEHGLLILPSKTAPLTEDERLAAGFQEIIEFVAEHGREPVDDVTNMKEATLAWRLDAIRKDMRQSEALLAMDTAGLLAPAEPPASIADALAGDTQGLLGGGEAESILDTGNLPKRVEPADEIATSRPAEDFERFKPMFDACHAEIRSGVRTLKPFTIEKNIRQGTFFVLRGVLCYVDDVGESDRDRHGKVKARLRVVFDNGTESNYLLRSFSRALYRHGRRVTDPAEITWQEMGLAEGTPAGYIYVLRSLSDDPQVTSVPDLHKIGFTTQSVAARLAGAADAMTYLNAPVEVVAEYRIDAAAAAQGIEGLLHTLFSRARMDVVFEERGVAVGEATEWFSVPLDVIDEAIELIPSGAIVNFQFDPETRELVLASE